MLGFTGNYWLMKSWLETKHLTALVLKLGGHIEENDGKVVALDLSHTKATDSDLKELFDLPSLKTLNLKGTRVTEDAVKRLKEKRPGLTVLR